MTFCTTHARFLLLASIFAGAFGFAGCHHRPTPEQKVERSKLRRALRDHAYEAAVPLARRIVTAAPNENGAWDRLIQAEFGLRDIASVKQSLADWRKAVRKPSSKLDEYTGDVALEEHDVAGALRAWAAVQASNPRNARVLEKTARLQRSQAHWLDAENSWTLHIRAGDNASARIDRAICRRHLHHWNDAFEDFHRAQELAADDPEVHRVAALFERLGKSADAIRDLDARIAVAPNDATSFADRALLFLRCEDHELALEDAQTAVRLAPTAVRPRLFEAIALVALGRGGDCEGLGVRKTIHLEALSPEFIDTLSRADADISVDEKNADLYVARAWQLNEIGQPLLAWQDAESAQSLDPNSASASVEAAYALVKLGRAEEAFARVKRASELDPNLASAWQYRGELELQRGDRLAAVDSLSHAIAITPTAGALQRREECYRNLGLLVKAEQDHKALEQFRSTR